MQDQEIAEAKKLHGAATDRDATKAKRRKVANALRLTALERRGIARLKRAESLRIVGARLREARVDINAMTLSYAAEKLCCENPSQLSKIENGHDPAPNWLILAAAKLYQVSADFLLGAAGDWEYSARMTQEREVGRFQAEETERMVVRQTNLNMAFHDELEWASGAIIGMAFSLEEVAATFKRVTEINVASWQEVKGGAKLASEIDKAQLLLAAARAGLKRFKRAGPQQDEKKGADAARETIRALAKMDLLGYYHSRRESARVLDLPVTILDKLVSAEQREQQNAMLLKSQFCLELSDGR